MPKSTKKQIINDIHELSQLLDLKCIPKVPLSIINNFPLRFPYNFAAKMAKGDINDPLLLQVLPQKTEANKSSGYVQDPLHEKKHSPIHGIIHKYPSKVLLLTTNNCLINCRFCFRRYGNDYIQDWGKVFAYISKNTAINEAILSGGDPLTLPDKKLEKIIVKLSEITNLEHLRIHTRIPIIYPQRITSKLIKALNTSRFKPVMVVHCNHPNEIDINVINAVKLLQAEGISLYSQSVLLKGVNDDAEVLIALSKKLFASGIQPYYIHLLDKVLGAQHFNVDINTAKKLFQQMALKLPGYLIPKLEQETPDSLSKTIIA